MEAGTLQVERKFQEETAKALAVLARYKAGAPNVDAAYVQGYAMLLKSAGVRLEDIQPAAVRLGVSPSEFFPNPGRFVETVRAIQAEERDTKLKEHFSNMVECVDDEGNPLVANARYVREGRLLKEPTGDGSPAPRPKILETREARRARMSPGARALLDRVTQSGCEQEGNGDSIRKDGRVRPAG